MKYCNQISINIVVPTIQLIHSWKDMCNWINQKGVGNYFLLDEIRMASFMDDIRRYVYTLNSLGYLGRIGSKFIIMKNINIHSHDAMRLLRENKRENIDINRILKVVGKEGLIPLLQNIS